MDPRARIVIDESMAQVGGGSTFALNLPVQLARQAPRSRFLLLVRNPRVAEEIEPQPNLEIRLLPPAGYAGLLLFPLLRARRISAEWSANLWFSAGEYTPEGADCVRIACFQNSTLWTDHPLSWPLVQRARIRALRWLARRSVRHCERIAFLSQDSSDWMGEKIGVPEAQRALLPCGVDLDALRPAATNARSHILAVGSVYEHKNYVRLIEAYAEVIERRPEVPDLVIIGKQVNTEYGRRMLAARAACAQPQRIRLIGWVNDDELRGYYRDAALFVFPSYLETFGIPLVEAMGARIPLVASDMPIFREVAGEAAFYANPHSTADLAAAIRRALEDAREVERRLEIGSRRAAGYSWKHSAERLLALFAEVLAVPAE